jgi:hypothetical protein
MLHYGQFDEGSNEKGAMNMQDFAICSKALEVERHKVVDAIATQTANWTWEKPVLDALIGLCGVVERLHIAQATTYERFNWTLNIASIHWKQVRDTMLEAAKRDEPSREKIFGKTQVESVIDEILQPISSGIGTMLNLLGTVDVDCENEHQRLSNEHQELVGVRNFKI